VSYGALKIETKGDDRALVFSASLCSGCGLCESFCMSDSVVLIKGFFGDNPFEFIIAKKSDDGKLEYCSIAVVAVLHLPGGKRQDLERRMVDPVLVKQHLLDGADDRFVVGGILPGNEMGGK
jgi:ferredoxin